MKRKIISYILLILWMGLIFVFSSQNGTKSSSISDGFVRKAIKVVDKDIDEDTLTKKVELINGPTRKLAHFFLYFVLGILSYNLLMCYNIKHRIIYALLLCFCYAFSDEIHQFFSNGRDCNFLDVLLDSFGSICGISLLNILLKVFSKKC